MTTLAFFQRIVSVFFMFFILFYCIAPSEGAWEKQGRFEGSITDIEIEAGLFFVTTAGAGIFRSSDGITWTNVNDGFFSLDVVAV